MLVFRESYRNKKLKKYDHCTDSGKCQPLHTTLAMCSIIALSINHRHRQDSLHFLNQNSHGDLHRHLVLHPNSQNFLPAQLLLAHHWGSHGNIHPLRVPHQWNNWNNRGDLLVIHKVNALVIRSHPITTHPHHLRWNNM